MKSLLVVLFLLAGCTTTSVEVVDGNGVSWDISYTAFGKKDLKDVNAQVGAVQFSLGSSSQDTPTISNEVIACLIAPALCQPQ